MQQLTIDDVKVVDERIGKRFKTQHDAGTIINLFGRPHEVIISNYDMMAVYSIHSEKVYPLRFVN